MLKNSDFASHVPIFRAKYISNTFKTYSTIQDIFFPKKKIECYVYE